MIDLSNKKAVFFDFGDTLTTTIETYPKRVEISLAENGYSFKNSEFMNAYLLADYQIFRHYRDSKTLDQSDHQKLLYKFLLKNLGLHEDPGKIMTKVKKTLGRLEYERVKVPGCSEILELLKSKGLLIAVISNNDGYTEKKCYDAGISGYLDLILDSTKCRIVKPDKKIFDLALERLELRNDEVIHIGDLYGSDVLGSKNAGIQPVWFNHRQADNYDSLNIPEIKNLYQLIELFS